MAKHTTSILIKARDDASRQFGKAGKSVDRFTSTVRKAAVAVGALLGARQLTRFASESLRLFGEAEKATLQLTQAVITTGKAAGFSARELQDYADELQKITEFGDEATESAIALLLTFKQIKGVVFKDTIRLAQDMSVAMGQDLKSSIIQMGKALNDPVLGLSALSRVGVAFTDTQKEMITLFVEQNDIMSAQKVILSELEGEFGGAAQASVKGYAGAVKQLANAWSDAREALGEYLVKSKDLDGSIRLTTILIENLADTWSLVAKQIDLSIQKAGQLLIEMGKLSPGPLGAVFGLAGTAADIAGKGKEDPIVTLEREMLEIQERLGREFGERLSLLEPVFRGAPKKQDEGLRGKDFITEDFDKRAKAALAEQEKARKAAERERKRAAIERAKALRGAGPTEARFLGGAITKPFDRLDGTQNKIIDLLREQTKKIFGAGVKPDQSLRFEREMGRRRKTLEDQLTKTKTREREAERGRILAVGIGLSDVKGSIEGKLERTIDRLTKRLENMDKRAEKREASMSRRKQLQPIGVVRSL